jgi:hypothetical protein
MNLSNKGKALWETRSEGARLRVLQASNLDDLLTIIGRGPGSWPYLPPLPKWNVTRKRFAQAIEKLAASISDGKKSGWVDISGEMGRGKSTAMAQLVHSRINSGESPIFFFIGRGGSQSSELEHIFRSICFQLQWKYGFFEDPPEWKNFNAAQRLSDVMRKVNDERLAGRSEIIFLDAADQIVLRDSGSSLPQVLNNLPTGFIWVITRRQGATVSTRSEYTQWSIKKDFLELVDEKEDAHELLTRRDPHLPWKFKFPDDIVAEPCPTMLTLDARLRAIEHPIPGDLAEKELRENLVTNPAQWRTAPENLVMEELGRVLWYAEDPANYKDDYKNGKIGARRALFVLGVHACAGRPVDLQELEALDSAGAEKTTKEERLYGKDARVILKRAANLFEGNPLEAQQKDEKIRFCHPSYAEAILHAEFEVPADESEAEKAKESET